MLTLIKNADVYAPEHLGLKDLLLEGGKIALIAPRGAVPESFPTLRVFDAQAQVLAPGFIDLHVHVTGGGGEDGFSSRSPESRLTDFSTAGVTTLVGLLGTDGVARSLEALYAKVCALTEEGVDCRMLTGAYGYPSPTLCGSVERDLVLIDRVIGAKIALSDHRSSEITYEELLRLATAVRRGGMLGGKAGLLTLHMGDGREGLSKLFRAAKESAVPLNTFLPTHVSRNGNLLEEAVRWIKTGGQADFTAGEPAPGGTARQMVQALSEGADVCRMTLSSDAFGSQPRFDAQGNCIGLTYGTSRVLHGELVNLVRNEGVPLETALRFITANPARVMHLSGKKGCIAEGADADLVLLGQDLGIQAVFARGRQLVQDGQALVKGRFE